MAHYDFDRDVVEGEAGEREVVAWLCGRFNGTLVDTNRTNTHDAVIEFPTKRVSFEIKTDVLVTPERDTGNLFVEYRSRGKPSGIVVSKADYFATYFRNLGELWIIGTKNLRKLIRQVSFRKVQNVGDPNSGTCGYLIPREAYAEHFIVFRTRSSAG